MRLGGHPHTLTLAVNGLRSTKVSQDDVTVELVLIDVARWCIEARAASQDALSLTARALLPSINLVLGYLSVEGDHGKLRDFCQLVQLGEERGEHLIVNRSRLVDADSDLGLTAHALACVDTREAFVKASRRRGLLSAL